jgi:hypothetical protein
MGSVELVGRFKGVCITRRFGGFFIGKIKKTDDSGRKSSNKENFCKLLFLKLLTLLEPMTRIELVTY